VKTPPPTGLIRTEARAVPITSGWPTTSATCRLPYESTAHWKQPHWMEVAIDNAIGATLFFFRVILESARLVSVSTA